MPPVTLGPRRELFDIPRDVAYFDCAGMTPLPRPVHAAGLGGIAAKTQPWRLTDRDFFTDTERARHAFARVVGSAPDDIAIAPSAGYGLTLAAQNLPLRPGHRVIVAATQPGTEPWRVHAARTGGEVLAVTRPHDGDWTSAVLGVLDERADIVALPGCLLADAAVLDLARIAECTRAVGAALVVDLTSTLGAVPFQVADVRPDFAVCGCASWLLGPGNLAFLYAAPQRQHGRTLEHGTWNRLHAEDSARRLEYVEDWQPGARRYDMGQRSNFTLLPMAIAGMELLLDWTIDRVGDALDHLTTSIAERGARIGLERAGHAPHVVAWRLPPERAERLAARGVHVGRRGGRLQVSPHLYNDETDVDRLFAALEAGT